MRDDLLNQVREASRDLQYPCHVAAPLVPMAWDRDEHLRASLDSAGMRAEVMGDATVDDFFADAAEHDPTRKHRWAILRSVLESNLKEIKIYRFGRFKGSIFIVGRRLKGDGFAGLHARFDYGGKE